MALTSWNSGTWTIVSNVGKEWNEGGRRKGEKEEEKVKEAYQNVISVICRQIMDAYFVFRQSAAQSRDNSAFRCTIKLN